MTGIAHSGGTIDGRVAFDVYLEQRAAAANSTQTQRLTVGLYRLLGGGEPVSPERLGRACGVPAAEVARFLFEFPSATMSRDERGAIVAFGGLSLAQTPHRFVTKDAMLFTWCVFDALFLPEILGGRATLTTHCPGSGAELTVELAAGSVRAARPSGCVMSIVAPDTGACSNDLRKAFCNHVNLFRDERAFRAWSRGRRDVGCVTIREAQHLARRRNALRYPDVELSSGK